MTATISLVAGSQPEGLITAAARLGASIASLEAQIATQRETLAQLMSGWQGDAARAALLRAEKNLQRQHRLLVRLQTMRSALRTGGGQLSALRTHILGTAGQATSLGGLVSDDGTVSATGTGRLVTPVLAAAYTALVKKLLATFDAVDEATASALTNAGAPQTPPHPPTPTVPDRAPTRSR
ncbi:MAG: hypothetical protein QOF31_3097 [Mycobacterium sp.]|nr:hypothetical protein [Mycobacterium sp.]